MSGNKQVQKDLSIDLKAISELINYYSTDSIHSIYAASQSGKTTLMLQLACEYSHKTGRPAIFYDTEGGGVEFVEAWLKVHKIKYPKARIIVRTKRNWKKILSDHGKEYLTTISDKGGKMSLKMIKDETDSDLAKLIVKEDVGFIMYDSITAPMKFFGTNRENFPARNSVQAAWFSSMIDLIDDHNITVIASHHSTKDPAQPWAAEEMAGGSAVQYYSKVVFYLKKSRRKGTTNYRMIKLSRYFDKPPLESGNWMELTNDGYVDRSVEDEEAANQKASKK